MARPKLGQHWLTDKTVLSKIADTLNLSKDETCIEIGGGKGSLTRIIAPLCRKLIVYEIDYKWAAHLEKFGPGWGGEIIVRETDALHIDWSRDSLELTHDEPLIIIGNLPFYITSPLLLRLAYSRLNFRSGIFLIQKEVAERITASPGDTEYSRLTVSLSAFVESKSLFSVPPDAFKPRPKVTSTLIEIIPRVKPLVDIELTDTFERTIKSAFHMRRKTLKNNLLAGFPDKSGSEIAEIISCIGIKPNARPQEVSVEEFVTITRMVGGNMI